MRFRWVEFDFVDCVAVSYEEFVALVGMWFVDADDSTESCSCEDGFSGVGIVRPSAGVEVFFCLEIERVYFGQRGKGQTTHIRISINLQQPQSSLLRALINRNPVRPTAGKQHGLPFLQMIVKLDSKYRLAMIFPDAGAEIKENTVTPGLAWI